LIKLLTVIITLIKLRLSLMYTPKN